MKWKYLKDIHRWWCGEHDIAIDIRHGQHPRCLLYIEKEITEDKAKAMAECLVEHFSEEFKEEVR